MQEGSGRGVRERVSLRIASLNWHTELRSSANERAGTDKSGVKGECVEGRKKGVFLVQRHFVITDLVASKSGLTASFCEVFGRKKDQRKKSRRKEGEGGGLKSEKGRLYLCQGQRVK